MKKFILTIVISIATLSLVSCNDWLDINYSPNSPSPEMVNDDLIFPAAEMALCSRYGDYMRFLGSYLSEHYTQFSGASNYLGYSRFTLSATAVDGVHTMLTTAIANATIVRDNSEAAGEWGSYLAATCIRVFAYQALVDAFGEISYTEAQKGAENMHPKFDEGVTVYEGLIAELNAALAKATDGDAVVNNFLFPNETAGKWIQFANALKLKIYMRERAKVSVDDKLTALVNAGNFPASDVAWAGCWADEAGKANPFYQEEFALYFGSTQINVGLNVALYRTMTASGDNRLKSFFSANEAGEYWGSISGYNMSSSKKYKSAAFCRPAMKYNSPVYLITVSEINFFLSEYYHKVAKDEVKAKEYYEAAIQASFASAGAIGAESVLAAWPYDGSDKNLGVQKWVALSGTNGFEAWCEMRRLKYPAMGELKAEDIYDFGPNDVLDASVLTPGELYTPYQVYTEIGAGKIAQRFPYPKGAQDYNKNCPEEKKTTVPVFWAE
ncbi:MAG: SusD/RagB family nutrient-binding outer membrane lipoprotein [Bacteroidales bacterium]|nr:SusD/RagB family nutrient-binding outer membrane lipoprotein [Bacteroidales bacterium]